jgi:chromosomal replication initiation ATPase DnaA
MATVHFNHNAEKAEAARTQAARYLPENVTAAALAAGTTVEAITSGDRHHEAIRGRWVVAHVLREQGLSLPVIGSLMGQDHTTVLNGLRRLPDDTDLWIAADTLAYRLFTHGPAGLARAGAA